MSAEKQSVVLDQSRYHNSESAYVLPKDTKEHNRLDAQAVAITEMLGGNTFLAIGEYIEPEAITKAVDIGCGTGIATTQVGSTCPNARVYGLDISPVPNATKKNAPPNVEWIIGNVLKAGDADTENTAMTQEIFQPESLNFAFGRMLVCGITDWKKYFSVVSKSLRSGGIVEHQDLDWQGVYRAGSNEGASDDWEWFQQYLECCEKTGFSNTAGTDAAQRLEDEGLEVLEQQTFEWSYSPSEKAPHSMALGRYSQESVLSIMPELIIKLMGAHGYNDEQLVSISERCLRDLNSEPGLHLKYTVTIAKKP